MGFIIYIVGCISAFLVIDKQYRDSLPESAYYEDTCAVFVFGTILSWIPVIIYLYNKCFNKE